MPVRVIRRSESARLSAAREKVLKLAVEVARDAKRWCPNSTTHSVSKVLMREFQEAVEQYLDEKDPSP